MAKTHWLQNPNKNYLGHWDLPETDLILTIESAKWEDVTNPTNNKSESKRVVRFKEDVKPLICNEVNAHCIVKATGIRYMEDTGGKLIALFRGIHSDRRTKEDVDCVRIRDKSPIMIDTTEDEINMRTCESLDSLKMFYTSLDKERQRLLFALKEEVKQNLITK